MNKVLLIGKLTKDPELKETSNGKVFFFGSLAVRRRMNKEKVDFIHFEIWGKSAATFCDYTKKGMLLSIFGELQTSQFVTRDDRQVSVTKVLVSEWACLERMPENETNQFDAAI